MHARAVLWAFFPLAAMLLPLPAPAAQSQNKDYLTPMEADRIRDAMTASEKARLLLSFAADRLKRFELELKRPAPGPHRAEILNGLLNGYSGCVDDAADFIQDGLDRREDVHEAIREMQKQAPKFLAELKKLQAGGPELASYKDTLDDAIEATHDAASDADKAARQLEPSERSHP
jgi:flagellar hook-basal body complex protein FliE